MIGPDYLDSPANPDYFGPHAKIAIGLAVGVHLIALLIGLISPHLLNRPRQIPEIYNVNLIAVTDPEVRPAPKPKEKIAKPEPPPAKEKTVSAPQEAAPPPVALPKAAVSTRPIRTKSEKDQKALEALRKQFHAEEKAKQANLDADKAVKDALSAIRKNLHSGTRPTIDVSAKSSSKAITSLPSASSTSGGQIIEEAKRKYFASVYELVKAHFVLPDLKNWESDLQSIMVVVVRRDGVVTKSYFEQRSKNIFFNQAVEKAINEAAPLPPFPQELKESKLEFGLRFSPGDLL